METENLYRCPPQLFEPNRDWKIFSACKRGRSHIATGKVSQDYCVAEKITEEVFVAAAADGHGGDAYVKSDVGSKAACNVIVALAKKYSGLDSQNFWSKWTSTEFKEELFDAWQTDVLKDYRAENPDTAENDRDIIRKYGTTLLFVVVTKSHIIIGQLGDGAILLFNDQNQSQLFKRHNPKYDSKTASLASGRGIYSLLIDSYKRFNFKFNKILLSTDGIYDKLDRRDNFARYANELAAQIKNKPPEEIQPFTVAQIDVSEKSSDDCTVIALVAPPVEKKCEIESQDLTDVKFERAYSRLEIYSASKEGVPLELHVSKYVCDENYLFDELSGKIKLLKSEPKDFRSSVNAFRLPEGLFRVRELIEHGEHLEKRYVADDDEPQIFTNDFWLSFYENIRELKELFCAKIYFAEENFFDTMLISASGEIYLFADCLSKALFKDFASRKVFESIENYFGFLGKIKCGSKVLPLFKCPKNSWGQVVPELHAGGKSFCRVLYNQKANSYGLQNLSGKVWTADDKKIQPDRILKLTKNFVLKLADEELVSYEIILFDRSDAL